MTNKEAIYVLNNAVRLGTVNWIELYQAVKLAVKAIEKQIQKKPYGNGIPQCPRCKGFTIVDGEFGDRYRYCCGCGQAIDWSEE